MSFKTLFPVAAYWLGKKKTIFDTLPYRNNPIDWTLKTYRKRFGIKLDLDNPKTFYEKMNYWKHNFFDEKQTLLADKLNVKLYLTELGYEHLCAKCLFFCETVSELKEWFLDNKNTYKRMVFKTNHSCGDVFIYDNGKIIRKGGQHIHNIKSMFRMLNIGLKFNHYYSCFERPYKDIKPMLFVEEYIDLNNDASEYEIMCNYGEFKVAKVVRNRQNSKHSEVTVDKNFKIINYECGEQKEGMVNPPQHLSEMLSVVKKTCTSFPFCRVDFIESGNKLFFCEFTFVKSGGINLCNPIDFNYVLGDMFKL